MDELETDADSLRKFLHELDIRIRAVSYTHLDVYKRQEHCKMVDDQKQIQSKTFYAAMRKFHLEKAEIH